MHNSGIHFIEIIDLLRQNIAIIDPRGFIVSVNRSWRLHSLEKGVPESFEWVGVNFVQIYNALAVDDGYPPNELDAVLEGREPFFCKEFKSSSRLETRCFTLEASTIYSPDGKTVKGALVCLTDITQNKLLEQNHLETLAQIYTLHGLLPICAVCKKIRDEHDIWNSIESFLEKHTKVEFTHDICPECIRRLYPEYSSLLDKSSCS
ncbi:MULTISPECIES: PAS domain-containing protein [unclassified Paenibacillus]|uniref:PAS domain-containing protein n=1 Tax=unclassified Paenibacillus TaxID=185978 RepID=UPI000838CF0A|nr:MULTISPECIES: PAS domain-containing protein [unclassified Paenibacillus]